VDDPAAATIEDEPAPTSHPPPFPTEANAKASAQPVVALYAAAAHIATYPTGSFNQQFLPLDLPCETDHLGKEIPFHSLLASGKHKLPKGFNYSPVDKTVRSGHLATQAKTNEMMGMVLPHGKMTITDCGFPMDEDSWNALAAQASIPGHIQEFKTVMAFIHLAQLTAADERLAYYHTAFKNWHIPEWTCNMVELKAPLQPDIMTTEEVHQHFPGLTFKLNGLPRLNQPSQASAPEEWAAWLYMYQCGQEKKADVPLGLLVP
jgi:hypothetical protein